MALAGLSLLSCRKESHIDTPQTEERGVNVALYMGGDTPNETGGTSNETGGNTKTAVARNGHSVVWTRTDKVALWAVDSKGTAVFSAQPFSLYGSKGGKAVFTSTLAEPMQEGTYTYTACYPLPTEATASYALFPIPSTQNGSGEDGVMVSDPTEGKALTSAEKLDAGGLSLGMNLLTHLLRFYLPEGESGPGGEAITRIEAQLPAQVTGTLRLDLTTGKTSLEGEATSPASNNPARSSTASSSPASSNGASTITIEPTQALEPGGDSFACACIYPTLCPEGSQMHITVYSDGWCGKTAPIDVGGRSFQAGHCTPVPLKITQTSPYYSITYRLVGNNSGESVQSLSVDGHSFTREGGIKVGDSFRVEYPDEASFRAMSGRSVALSFETEHATLLSSAVIGSLAGANRATVDITAPYLLFEDFSAVESFSSNDAYSTANSGNKAAVSFLSGWTGGRIGAESGKCIRIAGRRESGLMIDAHYPARADSAPLATLKKEAEIVLSFDYGTACEGINEYGQNIYVGYTTSTAAYASGATDGSFPISFNSASTGGSYDNTPLHAEYSFTVPAGTVRIAWRNDPEEHKDFASNTTCWLYIDNVKVQIKQ